MDRIDDPLDVAIKELQNNPENTPLEITKKLATAIIPGGALFDPLLEHFSTRKRIERIRDFLLIFKTEFQALQNECAGDKQRLEATRNYLRSPQFSEAVARAAEEAVRNTNNEKLKRLGRVLANGSDPSIEPSNADDLTSFIRDVSQLSEGDIQVLEQLASSIPLALEFVQGSQKSSLSESPLQSIIDDAQREKLLTDDFYSHCFRLVGFGLAAQIPSNSPSLAGNSHLFRLTRRGHRLLALLKQRT